jgi:hypothetical protein
MSKVLTCQDREKNTYYIRGLFFPFLPYPMSVTCTTVTWGVFSFHLILIPCRLRAQLSRKGSFLFIRSLSLVDHVHNYHMRGLFFLFDPYLLLITCTTITWEVFFFYPTPGRSRAGGRNLKKSYAFNHMRGLFFLFDPYLLLITCTTITWGVFFFHPTPGRSRAGGSEPKKKLRF